MVDPSRRFRWAAVREANRCGTSCRRSTIPCPARLPIPCPSRHDGGEMSETLLLAEPATEVSGTRPWYTVVWRERLSSLDARWGIAPAPGLQGDPRLPRHALSSSKSDESEASAACSALSQPVAHRPRSERNSGRVEVSVDHPGVLALVLYPSGHLSY